VKLDLRSRIIAKGLHRSFFAGGPRPSPKGQPPVFSSRGSMTPHLPLPRRQPLVNIDPDPGSRTTAKTLYRNIQAGGPKPDIEEQPAVFSSRRGMAPRPHPLSRSPPPASTGLEPRLRTTIKGLRRRIQVNSPRPNRMMTFNP
jgi:hypothetical protein